MSDSALHKIKLTVNGHEYEKEVSSRLLLSDFLRDELHMTGTHVGCEHGVCGACTIMVNGQAIRSCLMFAVQANRAEIITIEGLEQDGNLHPIQEAFTECHGLQCGFCTPGMMITAIDFLNKCPHPTDQQILEGMSGNICRCTGYKGIVEAVKKASEQLQQDDTLTKT